MARGRKRKPGKRHPCGKLVRPSSGETQAQILATVVDARQRHYRVTAAQARDQRLSSALGRLAFSGAVTQQQYEAGQRFGEVYHRHHVVTGIPLPTPRSVGGLMTGSGIIGSCTQQPGDDVVERVRRHYDAALQVLADVYEYWLLKRRRHGRPLVRSLQIPTSLDNQDPLLIFRCRGLLGVTKYVDPKIRSLQILTTYTLPTPP